MDMGKWFRSIFFDGRMAVLLVTVTAVSCSSGFNRGEMQSELRAANPVFTSYRVEQIEKLASQLKLPFRIAVTQPLGSDGSGKSAWDSEERTEILAWGDALREAGVVSELVILPASLTEMCGYQAAPDCRVQSIRAAAARFGADVVLFISLYTRVDEYVNPFSALNLTIVGLWLAPGHHRDALTMVEGILLDNRNEYLYATAEAEGQGSIIRPFVYADRFKAIRVSRAEALKAFGIEFVKQASQLKTR